MKEWIIEIYQGDWYPNTKSHIRSALASTQIDLVLPTDFTIFTLSIWTDVPKIQIRVCYGSRECIYIIDLLVLNERYVVDTHLKLLGNLHIKKTCLYNFDPLNPTHFYIVKLGFTGVYIIFLISAQNIDCGYPLEPPRRGSSNEYPQSMFWAEIWKILKKFIWKFSFFWW